MRFKGTVCLFLLTAFALGQVEERIRVIQRDLRVHVLDRSGNPIRGLTSADFLVFEDGNEQNMNFFQEVDFLKADQAKSSPAAQATEILDKKRTGVIDPQTSRTLVIVFDTSNMSKGGFEACRKGVQDLIGKLGPNDMVKLIQIDQDMVDLTAFTRNKEELLAGLETSEYRGAQYRAITRQERTILNSIEDWLNAPGGGLIGDETRIALAQQVNREVETKERLKNAFYRTFYYNMIYLANMLTHMSGSKSVFLFTGGSYIEQDGRFATTTDQGDRLNRTLNKANATVYSFLYKERTSRAEGLLATFARPDQLPLNALRQGWNFAEAVGMSTQGEQNSSLGSLNTVLENGLQVESGPDWASRGTGGVMVRTTTASNLEKPLDKVINTSSHYYRLGYSLEEPNQAARVRVRLTRDIPGARLLYGKEFKPRENYLDLEEEERELTLRTLMYFNDVARNDLDAEWKHHLFYREEKGFTIPVFGSATMLQKPANGFEVAFAAFDATGEALDLIISRVKQFPERKTFDFYDVLLTDEPPAYIKCYLRDMDTGDFSLMKYGVAKKETEVRSTRISDIMFGADNREPLPLNHTRQVIVEKGEVVDMEALDSRVVGDPMLVNNKLFKTGIVPEYKDPEEISLMFHVENLPEGKHDLTANFIIYSEKDGAFPVEGKITNIQETGNAIRYVATVNASELKPGEYQLLVRVTKRGMAGELRKAQAFAVK